jgi:hypothetical protein
VDCGDGVEGGELVLLVSLSCNMDAGWVDGRGHTIMYIFQLILQRRGGTKSANRQFQVQFEAVASETALARTLAG